MLYDTMKLGRSVFGVTPKGLNTVDVLVASDKFIVAVIDPEMPINANVHQAVLSTPTICVTTLLGSTFPRIMA